VATRTTWKKEGGEKMGMRDVTPCAGASVQLQLDGRIFERMALDEGAF